MRTFIATNYALNVPAIATAEQRIQVGSDRFYYRGQNELLHVAREHQAILNELKRNIGSESFEAQYQQCPVPPGGHMFKRDWLHNYSIQPEIADDDTVSQSWDTATKTGFANDWSVGTTWLYKGEFYYLLDVVREKLDCRYLQNCKLRVYLECAQKLGPCQIKHGSGTSWYSFFE